MYQRIRDLREDHDLLQKDLAAYLKCSQVCYSNYENGRRDVPTEVLIRLSEFYQTSVDYLLGLTEEKKAYPRRK
ncbi:MAG: helix-turn-helix transcriptional regulator [Clostridia bacterium]|jgi:transcriptional regulator with XRE-family HTH domain|nr:helix-turn-helix transcriptional regulator [Clostridia bacterium]